jgi:hypothetical protein
MRRWMHFTSFEEAYRHRGDFCIVSCLASREQYCYYDGVLYCSMVVSLGRLPCLIRHVGALTWKVYCSVDEIPTVYRVARGL